MASSTWKKGYDPSPGRLELKELRAACDTGDLERVSELFDSSEWYEGQVTHFLFMAALRGHPAVVRFLLDKGVDIGSAPFAVVHQQHGTKSTAVLELFMEYGWKVNDADSDGQVILPYATLDESLVTWLLDRGADPNLGHTRGAMARFQMAQSVVDPTNSVQEEATRIDQLTNEFMENASEREKNEIRKNITSRMSHANLMRFQREDRDPAVLFYRNKAVGRIRDERDPPPPPAEQRFELEDGPPFSNSGDALNSAASQSTIAVVNLLIERGAKLENSLCLHSAAENNVAGDAERIPMLDHLLALGLDINGTDETRGFYSWGTPLHLAVLSHKLERARFLLEKGADPYKRNRAGKTPLEVLLPERSSTKNFSELFRKWSTKKSERS